MMIVRVCLLALGVTAGGCFVERAPDPSPATPEPPAPAEAPVEAAHRPESLAGTWKMVPDEARLRELKIIAAATSKDAKVERLGDLTPQEQAIFDEWAKKKGKEVEEKLHELTLARNYLVVFTDTEVTLQYGTERFGPFPYTLVSQTDTNTTISFDPGFGNGVETHALDFSAPARGTDTVTTANGQRFDPVALVRLAP